MCTALSGLEGCRRAVARYVGGTWKRKRPVTATVSPGVSVEPWGHLDAGLAVTDTPRVRAYPDSPEAQKLLWTSLWISAAVS